MTERFCRTCAWCNQSDDYGTSYEGVCRYDAPSTNVLPWPAVRKDDWCRHWAKTRGWVEEEENQITWRKIGKIEFPTGGFPEGLEPDDTPEVEEDFLKVGCKDLVEMQTAEIKRLNARFEKARYVVKLLMATYDRDSLRVEYAEAKQWLDEESDD